ncbi:site-specific integrase [Candidatus Contubernalis alkaliaceticus]|uniref:site-specific integrase n=1 Tax=Candidatus Contubernalis alkaliaceticus TaxID=338645 RepID=UPI001F4C324B|nr:site-specific integrase [Candidatus Contubernalis alkalaceticus]UNC92136.1 tyrosine-type recombinase/integrase [Candidatus Contubernalis alkalaceticus]
MNSTISLAQLIDQAKHTLQEKGYRKSTKEQYHRTWHQLLKECTQLGITTFSFEVCMEILQNRYRIFPNSPLKDHQRNRIRHLKVLDDLWNGVEIRRCHQKPGSKAPEIFNSNIDNYVAYCWDQLLAEKTVTGKRIHMISFLCYLHENEVNQLSSLDPSIILDYVRSLSEKGYTEQTQAGILFTLRDFLSFLFRSGQVSESCGQLFPIVFTRKNHQIPSTYSVEERKKLLSLVDRNSCIGKRDYAILILAVQFGIRAGDIRLMKMEHLQWSRDTIEFVQQKTGNAIILPMYDNTKLALIDYIRHSRPKSDSPFLFVRMRAPFEPYSDMNTFQYIIASYLDKAEIDYSGRKHGLHSMRHSLANSLLQENTPYPIISGILGHENSNTTKRYLAIDTEQLRKVALEVPYER